MFDRLLVQDSQIINISQENNISRNCFVLSLYSESPSTFQSPQTSWCLYGPDARYWSSSFTIFKAWCMVSGRGNPGVSVRVSCVVDDGLTDWPVALPGDRWCRGGTGGGPSGRCGCRSPGSTSERMSLCSPDPSALTFGSLYVTDCTFLNKILWILEYLVGVLSHVTLLTALMAVT